LHAYIVVLLNLPKKRIMCISGVFIFSRFKVYKHAFDYY